MMLDTHQPDSSTAQAQGEQQTQQTQQSDGAQTIVLDTNIVLDLFIFSDPRCASLREALQAQQLHWVATQVMRDELERVLDYTHLQPRMAYYQVAKAQVLAQFDAAVHIVGTAAKAPYICKDADDQKFIDVAVAHRSVLVSKDKAVLCMRKRLATLGVAVSSVWATQNDNSPASVFA
jgi:putative PIN family toxin of toxin-antitoxin system